MKRFTEWIARKQLPKEDIDIPAMKLEGATLNARMVGYQSGLLGFEAWANPYIGDYDTKNDFSAWQRGWCSGRQERSQKDE